MNQDEWVRAREIQQDNNNNNDDDDDDDDDNETITATTMTVIATKQIALGIHKNNSLYHHVYMCLYEAITFIFHFPYVSIIISHFLLSFFLIWTM